MKHTLQLFAYRLLTLWHHGLIRLISYGAPCGFCLAFLRRTASEAASCFLCAANSTAICAWPCAAPTTGSD